MKQFKLIKQILFSNFINKLRCYGLRELALIPIFVFGIIFLLIPQTKEFATYLSPFMLLIIGVYVLYPEIKNFDLKFFAFILIIFIATISLEAIGTATGLIF